MTATAAQALYQLKIHPRRFLRRYPLDIEHPVMLPSGLCMCSIADSSSMDDDNPEMAPPALIRPGSILRNLRKHNAEQRFSLVSGSGGGMIAAVRGLNNADFVNFRGLWLRMSEWDNGADIYGPVMKPLTLDQGGTADLMLTLPLTGCTIAVFEKEDGCIDIVHIRPSDGTIAERQQARDSSMPVTALDGQASHQVISRSGWTTVYGKGDYGGSRVIVVGVRRGGKWRIYAQKQDSSGGVGSVRDVDRIYP